MSSVAGLCNFGYNVNFNYHHRADATTDRGQYFLEPESHGKPSYIPYEHLTAPIANSSSTTTSKETAPPQAEPPTTSTSNATIEHLWCKYYRPQTSVCGTRRSGKDDDWVYTADGKYAIGVHLRSRSTRFTPSAHTMGQKGEPRLDILYAYGISPIRSAPCPL